MKKKPIPHLARVLAAGAGTPGRAGHDYLPLWSGRGPAAAGSSCRAPLRSGPAPWTGSPTCAGGAEQQGNNKLCKYG